MITIVDKTGKDKIVCTKGTFEEQYKVLGYRIASKEKEATKEVASIDKQDKKIEKTDVEKTEEEKISEKYITGKTTKKGK
jgi:hypothetical protein